MGGGPARCAGTGAGHRPGARCPHVSSSVRKRSTEVRWPTTSRSSSCSRTPTCDGDRRPRPAAAPQAAAQAPEHGGRNPLAARPGVRRGRGARSAGRDRDGGARRHRDVAADGGPLGPAGPGRARPVRRRGPGGGPARPGDGGARVPPRGAAAVPRPVLRRRRRQPCCGDPAACLRRGAPGDRPGPRRGRGGRAGVAHRVCRARHRRGSGDARSGYGTCPLRPGARDDGPARGAAHGAAAGRAGATAVRRVVRRVVGCRDRGDAARAARRGGDRAAPDGAPPGVRPRRTGTRSGCGRYRPAGGRRRAAGDPRARRGRRGDAPPHPARPRRRRRP